MKSSQSEASPSPQVHSANIQRELSQLIAHVEADTRRVKDQRFRGLLEKSAEVLKGLRTLFERFGSGEPAGGNKTAQEARSAKGEARTTPSSGKPPGKKKSAKSGRSEASNRGADKKATNPNGDARPAKTGGRGQENSTVAQSSGQETPAQAEPVVAMTKPEDPDEIAAKAEQQRREARAPKTPGGNAAPRPIPPRSGKPVWSKPHSS